MYRFRDTRTHMQRENDALKRREERSNSHCRELKRLEELEQEECTFHPMMYSRPQDNMRSVGGGSERASSCGAVSRLGGSERQTPQERTFQAETESHRADLKLQKIFSKQQLLIQQHQEVVADQELAHSHKDSGQFQGDLRDTNLQLYKRNVAVVHGLDMLDIQVLELPQAQLDLLLAKGYRIGLGEKSRGSLVSSPEASQLAFADSPRNNIREARPATPVQIQSQEACGAAEAAVQSQDQAESAVVDDQEAAVDAAAAPEAALLDRLKAAVAAPLPGTNVSQNLAPPDRASKSRAPVELPNGSPITVSPRGFAF